MLKTLLNTYLIDLGLNILFEGVYKNMVAPNLVPVMEGNDMRIDAPNFSLVLRNVYGDVTTCVKLGQEIVSDIMFLQVNQVVDFIYNKYEIVAELEFKY